MSWKVTWSKNFNTTNGCISARIHSHCFNTLYYWSTKQKNSPFIKIANRTKIKTKRATLLCTENFNLTTGYFSTQTLEPCFAMLELYSHQTIEFSISKISGRMKIEIRIAVLEREKNFQPYNRLHFVSNICNLFSDSSS